MTKRNPLERKVRIELKLGSWMAIHDILQERVVSEFKSCENFVDAIKHIRELDVHDKTVIVGAQALIHIHKVIDPKVHEVYNDKIAKA